MKRLNAIMLCLSTLFSCAGLTTGCFAAGPAIEQPQALPLAHLQKANKLFIIGGSGDKGFQRTVPEVKRKDIISCLVRAQGNDPGPIVRRGQPPEYGVTLFFYLPEDKRMILNMDYVRSVKEAATAQERSSIIKYFLPDEDYQKLRSIIEELIPPETEWTTGWIRR